MRATAGKARRGTTSLVGWPDAAFGDQPSAGKRRAGYVIVFMSSAISGPFHPPQWASKFAREVAESSLAEEAYAFSEMVDRVVLSRVFFAPVADSFPGMI